MLIPDVLLPWPDLKFRTILLVDFLLLNKFEKVGQFNLPWFHLNLPFLGLETRCFHILRGLFLLRRNAFLLGVLVNGLGL